MFGLSGHLWLNDLSSARNPFFFYNLLPLFIQDILSITEVQIRPFGSTTLFSSLYGIRMFKIISHLHYYGCYDNYNICRARYTKAQPPKLTKLFLPYRVL